MFISKIEILNFRNFSHEKITTIEFNEGVNVITGHNNAGKTNLIKALQLIIDSKKTKSKLTIDDFHKGYNDFSEPPSINISITLTEQEHESPDDKVVLYDWITSVEELYEAKLSFSFFLPQGSDYDDYKSGIQQFKKGDTYDSNAAWTYIQKYFLPKYVKAIYGGLPENKETADNSMLDKFDFQFLDAIRDAEGEMFYGNNTILKNVINYFLDYDITEGKSTKDLSSDKVEEIKDKEDNFRKHSTLLFEQLKGRISKDGILKYVESIGADKGGKPDFDVHLSESDLLFALRLVLEINNMKIPISNNGLGYNNLLFMALVLAKMQIESKTSYYGENAKVFPLLAIEEPEAHLHPAMQHKFLSFLQENTDKNSSEKVRQVFISTHSTHITSAVELDSIICLYRSIKGEIKVGYPGKALENHEDSKHYITRFLDATKSNLLFADKVIFVEGLAEQILLPCFAAYNYYDEDNKITQEQELINQHVGIISVDSRTFFHFLRLFTHDDNNPYAIEKKVLCITDADPHKQGDNKAFPFELDNNSKPLASHVETLKNDYASKYSHIYVVHPTEGKGKTLEYELMRYNPENELLLTNSFPKQKSAHTIVKFKQLQEAFGKDKNDYDTLFELYESLKPAEKQKEKFEKIKQAIANVDSTKFSDEEKSIAFLSAIYYQIVEPLKGEHALFLEKQLRENLAKEEGAQAPFTIPEYIKNGIDQILKT